MHHSSLFDWLFPQKIMNGEHTRGFMFFFKFMTIVLLPFLSGCATFRHGADPAITKWPLDVTAKRKTIDIQLTYCNDSEKCPEEMKKNSQKLYDTLVKIYESSGLFSVVKSSSRVADIQAVVNVDKLSPASEWGRFFAEMSLRSLFIIPIYFEQSIILESTYKDNTGNTLGSFNKSESAHSGIWAPLILLSPFFYPESVKEEIICDLIRNTIIDAHSKGIF
jgi:hypothetical protein